MQKSSIADLRLFAVTVEGGLVQTTFAASQEEAYGVVERMTGRKAIRDPSLEAQNAKRNGSTPAGKPEARKHESADEVFARRERERVAYEGPGVNDSTGDKADADFARRAAQVEASKT